MAARAPRPKRPSTESLAQAAPSPAPRAEAPRKAARDAEAAPRPAARVREKVVAALRRLHPMD
jgi:hypothetical protein